ncbi:hypothetical protein ABZ927_26065 [Streptomyces massasporeus]
MRPVLRRATYQWTDNGTPYTFTVGLDDLTDGVYIRGGADQATDLADLFGRRRTRKAP